MMAVVSVCADARGGRDWLAGICVCVETEVGSGAGWKEWC